MWTRLTQEYAQVAVANSNKLTANLFQYNMNPDHAVMAYINRMRQMAEELRCVNAAVTDQQLITRILQTLSQDIAIFSQHGALCQEQTKPLQSRQHDY